MGASQPSSTKPLQSRKPTAHSQTPALQAWFAAQALPQAPQLVLSDDVSVSQPFAGTPSQFAVPVGHTQ
jgi:hypothetical protein